MVFSSIPLLRSGFLTPSVHFPPSCCRFGLNHIYQSLLYRLNPNPHPSVTLLRPAIVFPSPRCYSEWWFRTVRHPPSTLPRRTLSLPLAFHNQLIHIPARPSARFNVSDFKFSCVVCSLACCILLSSLSSSICS